MAVPAGRLRSTHVESTSGFLIDTLDRSCELHDLTYTYKPTLVDAKGVCSGWNKNTVVKEVATLDFQLRNRMDAAASAYQNPSRNIDVSVFSLLNYSGTSDYVLLSGLRSGSITVTNETEDGSAINSRWEEANIVSSNLELKGSFVIDINDTTSANAYKVLYNAQANGLAWDGARSIAHHTMGAQIVIGSNQFDFADDSLVLSDVSYGIAVDSLQTIDIGLQSNGAPQATMANFLVAGAGGVEDAILNTIFSGDSLLTIVLDQNITSTTGLELGSTLDHWVVTSCSIEFSNGQVDNISVSCTCTGDPNGS